MMQIDLPEFVLTEAGEVVQPVPMAIWPAVDAGDVRQRGKTWLFPPVVGNKYIFKRILIGNNLL